MNGPRTTDRLTGPGKLFLAQMVALQSKPRVKVGVLGKDFDKPKDEKAKGDALGGTKVTVGMTAVWAEFGTSSEPERSWLRGTVDKKWQEWHRFANDLRWQIVNEGKTVEWALGRMGAKIESDLKAAIRSDIGPPNAPATLAAKAPKTHTLINTGQFLNSIAWELNLDGDALGNSYRPIGAE